jgi:hypothetical protein
VRVAALHGVVSEHQCARFHLLRVLHRQLRKNGVHRRRCEVRHHHRTVRVPVLRPTPSPSPFSPLPSSSADEPAGLGRGESRVDRDGRTDAEPA